MKAVSCRCATAAMIFLVPHGLAPELAALTEPMAVALHAVRRSELGKGDVAIVVGCGPVGLSIISHLKVRGVHTVVASDLSAVRGALASRCGADVVVDPGGRSGCGRPQAAARGSRDTRQGHDRSRQHRVGSLTTTGLLIR